MKLRHKKPLNPYMGQTNNDKSVVLGQTKEFNDEDFKKQGASLQKKNQASSTDQLLKYARILSNFVKTINQDYHLAPKPTQTSQMPLADQKPPVASSSQPQQQRQTVFTRKQQLKQPQQLSKLQYKMDQQLNQPAPNIKKRETTNTTHLNKQTKNPNNGSLSTPAIHQNTTQSSIKNKPEKLNQNNIKNIPQKADQNKLKNGPPAPAKTPTNPAPSPNLLPQQNANIPANLNSYFNNFQGMLNQSPIANNFNLMNLSGMNQLELTQLLMNSYNQNLIYSGMPGLNMNNLAMMGLNLSNTPLPPKNNFPLVRTEKPITNLFQEQLSSFKGEQKPKDTRSAYPLKRSAFHIAIAYKIYLDKERKKGKSLQTLEDIDPTKHARRVKNSQQSKNAKQQPKDQSKQKK